MGKNNNVIKLAFTGSTKLTKQAMQEVLKLQGYSVIGLFGLSDEKLSGKVNSVTMDSFCEQNKINLDKSEDWENFFSFCLSEKIDMIISLGDSRIVPKKIVNNFEVIGNHGAVLPYIQGGASLVWGRMFNLGHWGISIMRLAEKVDSGEILKIKGFKYAPFTSEADFVKKADNLTVEALLEVLNGDVEPIQNRKWDVRVSKHTDSHKVSQIYKYCLENDLCIYLPPRTPTDGQINEEWPKEFIKNFMIANNSPYPRWRK